MAHDSSFNKQLKRQLTARAAMNKSLPSENLIDFTEYVEKQKEKNRKPD